MTRPGLTPTPGSGAPEISVAPSLAASAGTAASIPVTVRHRGSVPAILRVTVLGLDSRWAPEPVDLGPVQPGETAGVVLTLVPERGAMGARYPFTVAVEAAPLYGGGDPLMGIAESVLVVDSQERIAMTIQPPTPVAVFSKRFELQITNPGTTDRDFTLLPAAAHGASVSLAQDAVRVPAQRTVTVRGRVRVRHPTVFGADNTFTFGVSARGVGAPEFAEATVRARPVFSRGLRVAVGLLAVLAVWVAAAVIFIPKISDRFTPKVAVAAPATVTSVGPSASSASPGATGGSGGTGGTGTAGTGGTGAGGGGGAGAGSGGTGGAGAPGGASNAGYQVAGTIGGPSPAGTTVSLAQVTLVEAADIGASPAPGTNQQTGSALREAQSGAFAKVYGGANALTSRRTASDTNADTATDTATGTMKTSADGAFQFSGVQAPGYYLLTAAKAGFQTQKFLIDSTDLTSPTPLKITMAPADGSLSGKVTGPDGTPIGAATVTITDGTVSLQTSSVSPGTSGVAGNQGTPGSWTVNGVSTPGTYLISAASPGFGTSSRIVTLDAGGKATADLTLQSGVAQITGTVSGQNENGVTSGLGGISVSATDGTTTVSATTTTAPSSGSQALAGLYTLPNLPIGRYTLTVSGDGYQTQTSQVTLTATTGSARVDISLIRSLGTVTGTVTGPDSTGKTVGLDGVGLTLTNATGTFKTMSNSASQQAGSFVFTGVPPGVYVLTASQYGRAPDSRNVTVVAAATVTQNLQLEAASNIAFPTQSFITGSVIDARSQGPLTCDRTVSPLPPAACRYTATTQAAIIDPATGKASGSTTISTVVPATSRTPYLLPSTDDQQKGLPPGLYTVTVTAPGYEPGSVTVEVGVNQRVTASQVALQPLAVIAGTVSYRTGTPTSPTCVLAVPSGAAEPTLADLGATPSNCTTTRPDGHTATVGSGGSYEVRGLTHGSYQLIVLPTDPEFLATPVTSILIAAGSDGHFDAAVDRLGRLQVTMLTPDPVSGALSPAPAGTTATAVAKDGASTPLIASATSTDASGVVTLTGLQTGSGGSYDVTVSNATGRGEQSVATIGLNQTATVTIVVIPEGTFAVVGRMTTTFDGGPVPAAGVQVSVTGVVGYIGQSPITKTATATTDPNGCFAILPAGWPSTGGPALATPDCPAIDRVAHPEAVGSMPGGSSLVIRPITVAAQGNSSVDGIAATASMISADGDVRSIPATALTAKPSPFGGHILTLAQPSGGWIGQPNNAIITVTRAPSTAAGPTVSVSAVTTSTGALRWQDASLGANLVVPGNYTLAISLQGYVSTTATMVCNLGQACVITDDAGDPDITLQQRPSITGSLFVPAPLPASITQSDLVAHGTLASGPPGIGAVTVSVDAAQQVLVNGTLTGYSLAVHYSDPLMPHEGLAQPSVQPPSSTSVPYVFSFSILGYSTASATLNCGQYYNDKPDTSYVNGCQPIKTTMKALPQATSHVLSDPGSTELSDATVQVTPLLSSTPAVTLTWDGTNSVWVWQQSGLPAGVVVPDTYTVTASRNGYDQEKVSSSVDGGTATSTDTTFTCTAGASSCALTVTMAQRTTMVLNFVNNGSGPTPSAVRVAFGGTGISSSTIITAANTVSYPGLIALSSASFEAYAQAGGFLYATFSSSSPSSAATCTGSRGTNLPGLAPQPGPTTTCTIKLTPLGSVIGTTVGRTMVNGVAKDSALGSLPVTLKCTTAGSGTHPCDTSQTFTGASDGGGNLTITGTNSTQGLGDGVYALTTSLDGYSSINGTVTINSSYYVSAVSGTGLAITGTAGTASARVTIALAVQPVTFQAQFFAVTGGAVLPSGTYTLAGANGSYSCTVDAADLTGCAVATGGPSDATGPYVDFGTVNPGSYTLSATPTSNASFNPASSATNGVTVQVPTTSSLLNQSTTLQLTLLTSVQTVTVTDASSNALEGIDVALIDPVTGAVSVNVDNQPMDVLTPSSGQVTFSGVPNGSYLLCLSCNVAKNTTQGYQPQLLAINFAAYVNPHPATKTVPLQAALRDVTLTLTSAAGADMSNATVTLYRTKDLSGNAATGTATPTSGFGNVYGFSQLAVGTWHAEVTGQTGGGTGAAVTATGADFVVTAAAVNGPVVDGTPLQQTARIIQGAVSLSISWTGSSCTSGSGTAPAGASGPPFASTTVDLIVTNTGTGKTATVTGTVDDAAGTVTASLYLPPGSYSWAPAPSSLAATWTWPSTPPAVTVPAATGNPASVAPQDSSQSLTSPTTLTTVTATVDGSVPVTGLTVTTTRGATAGPHADTDAATGSVQLCLAPATNWTVSIKDPTAALPILVPDQTNVTIGSSPASLQFKGYTLTIGAVAQQVPNRPADTRAVTLSLTGSAVSSAYSTTVTVNSTSTTPAALQVIVGSGSASLTATPPGTDAYGAPASATAITIPTTQTSAQTATATLPYVAAILAATLTGGTNPANQGATVSLTQGGSPAGGTPVHAAGSNVYTFFDLAVSTSYVVTAVGVDGATTYVGQATQETSATKGATTSAGVTLRQGPVLRVSLPSVGGTVPSGATVYLYDSSGVQLASLTANSSGEVFFPGPTVAAGTAYKVRATWTNGGNSYASAVVGVTSGTASTITPVTVTLTLTTGLAITVKAPVGTAGALTGVKADVTVIQNGVQVGSGTADASGALTVTGLARSVSYDVTATYSTTSPAHTYSGSGSKTTNNSATAAALEIDLTEGP